MQIDWKLLLNFLPDFVQALAWPAVAAFALYLFREPLIQLAGQLARRARKLSVSQVSVELATLPELSTTWTVGSDDVRRMTSSQIFDSISQTLFDELLKTGKAEYAVVDLRAGKSWLTSRLYIFALILGAVRGLRAFVFLESAGGVRRRFLGVATPADIQQVLSTRYPWLEEAFFRSAGAAFPAHEETEQPGVSKFTNLQPVLTGAEHWRVINLVQTFVQLLQRITPPPKGEQSSYLEVKIEEYLFAADLKFEADLKRGKIAPGFRQEFENWHIPLSEESLLTINAEPEAGRWQIQDAGNQTYLAVREGNSLRIHRTRRWERTRWIDGERLERDLAGYLEHAWYQDSPDQARSLAKEAIARRKGSFVALVNQDRQFLGLVDRLALVDQMWNERDSGSDRAPDAEAG